MSEIGYPFGGSVWYSIEDSYGGGHAGSQYRFSDAVQVCRLESGDVNKSLRHVGDSRVTDFVKVMVDPRLHVEYIWQPHTGSTISDFIDNRTNCDLNSFTVEFEASGCRPNSSYYLCKGCKPDSVNISASTGEEYVITIDFSVKSVATSSSSSGSDDPGAIGTTFASFNKAGSITWGTGSYYVTNSIDITVNNNLNDYWDVGSTDKKASIPGGKDVTGSVDVSMDEGGAIHWGTVAGGTDIASIKFDTACDAGTYDVITVNNLRFDSTSIEQNVSGEGMFDSVPFTAKDLSISTS
jgi:hypothetical protein